MKPIKMRERIDFSAYVAAVPKLVMHPVILLGPLLVSVIDAVVRELFANAGGLGAWLFPLLVFVLDSFGLAIAIIVADSIWRRNRASFDDAWEEARRKAGDIIIAGIGVNFVTTLALYVGSLIFEPIAPVLGAIAVVFVIYSIAASAIGGVPGSASLQYSLDIVRREPINAVILSCVFLLVYILIGGYVPVVYFSGFGTASTVIQALFKAIALSYTALVMAKRYNDTAFRGY